ncbi:MAG: HlyD family efflux transporter periplasmic adaptor subunit [Planctomycetaceae bacterium]|nr:HlyD family efflux transporter periplasmic adaptor subunit [Planctomycetaceae bacterium]
MDSLDMPQIADDTTCEALPAPRPVMIAVCLCSLVFSLGMTNWLDASADQVWRGRLETATEVVVAPLDSTILSLELQAGDEVEVHQAMLTLDTSSLDRQINEQLETIQQLELELQQIEAKSNVEISWRLKEIDGDIHSNKLKSADLLKEKYLADFSNVAWSNVLRDRSGIQTAAASGLQPLVHSFDVPNEVRIQAMLQQEAAHNASEVYSAQVELLEQRLAELKSIRSDLSDQIRNAHGIPLLKHRIEQAQAEADRLQERREQSEILSPAYGTVGLFRSQVGQTVTAGQPLVEILDRAQQYVTISVRSRDLPLFEMDQEVAVRFPGEVNRRGIVSAIPPQVSEIRDDGESFSELRITPTDKSWPPLPFGSNVEVSLLH